MADRPKLMTDREVQQFIVTGFTIADAAYPAAFHAGICQKLDAVLEKEGNLGNNILPRVPEIAQVFEHPNVRGALTSLLGEDYIMNPHRHCHLNPAGSKGQNWHKDCYVYDHNLRHPRFDWVLAFYYPQETTEDMGPSSILPGMQNLKGISSPNPNETEGEELAVCGPAGTVALIHFDSWHRASANTSQKNRYMLKFQFARTSPHTEPSWEHKSKVWSPGLADASPRVSRDVWNWMLGEHSEEGAAGISAEFVSEIEKAYACRDTPDGIAKLVSTLREESVTAIQETEAKTPDNAHGTNPTPSSAAFALASIGEGAVSPVSSLLKDSGWWVRANAAHVLYKIGSGAVAAVPSLVQIGRDQHWWVRRNVVEALMEIGEPTDAVTDVIASGLADRDYRVRRAACLAVARSGPKMATLVEALAPVLRDDNRYNRFYATLALRRVATLEAQDVLLDDLFVSRWCPITTKDDRY